MPLSRSAVAIPLLHLFLMVYINPLGSSPACDEILEESCIINMTLRNFRLILSWELKNKSITPSHYTLWQTIMSKLEDQKIVEYCTNTTKSFCDLTDVWKDMHESYTSILEVYGENSMMFCCGKSIFATNIDLEPPEFDIVGLTDQIIVTVKFPPITPKLYGREIGYSLSLVIQQLSEGVPNVHRPKMPKDIHGNFIYVIDNLTPNTNHCISVYLDGNVGRPIKPLLKCTFLQPIQESGSSESAIIGVLIPVFLIAVIFIFTFTILKRIGYICLKHNFPKVLNFHNFLVQIFPELPSSEAVDAVEVIYIHRKKKLWNYDYDDESDSDKDVPKSSAPGYTMHGLMGRLLSQAPASSSADSQESQGEDTDTKESDEPAVARAEPKPSKTSGPNPWQSEGTSGPCEERDSLLQYPFPREDSGSIEEPGDRIAFNVDLKSVFLRVLHSDSEEASEESSEALPPAEEDTVGLEEDPLGTESGLLVVSGERTQLPHSSLSSQCLWSEDDISLDTTDASDSEADTNLGSGYIMR